jgi:aquaporin Z
MNKQNFPWKVYIAEFGGTAILLLVGLSLVIFMFGTGSPIAQLLPNVKVRQSVTGFLFGATGASIALSPIGRASGAHINPAVTMVFWLFRKIEKETAWYYVLAQLLGGIAGCFPLLLWGEMGKSIDFGATVPGRGFPIMIALAGEVAVTFAMVSLLVIFLGFRQTRRFTPAIFPVLFAILVPLEASLSGTSANPARSLGPSVLSGVWEGWWIYWIGPLTGAFLASLACSMLAKRITVAKLYHFDSDHDGLLRKKSFRH